MPVGRTYKKKRIWVWRKEKKSGNDKKNKSERSQKKRNEKKNERVYKKNIYDLSFLYDL